MAEKISLQETAPQHVNVIPLEQGVEELRRTVEFVPLTTTPDEDSSLPWTDFIGTKNPDGEYIWSRSFAEPENPDAVLVDPLTHIEDQPIFAHASEQARSNDFLMIGTARQKDYWWDTKNSRELVQNRLKEVYRISEGDNKLDILNCSEENLSQEEQQSLVNVFNAVANYTGNKVFSRVRGIVLAPGDQFENNAAGDHQASVGVVRVNMDVIRNKAELGRYGEYFKEGQTNWLELVTAHEIGHAMDISSIAEIEQHGIDITSNPDVMSFHGHTRDIPAFSRISQWTPLGKNENGEMQWQLDELEEAAEAEEAPTPYARLNPSEDFAECFAIEALGGDLSDRPLRAQLLKETVRIAEGAQAVGPKKVSLERVDTSERYPAKEQVKVGLRVFVQG